MSDKKKIVIAVDGPSASGKGTLAKRMAEHFGFAWLDTGSLYRAVALFVLKRHGNPSREEDVFPILSGLSQVLTPEILNDPGLRGEAASQGASQVAAMPQVRQALFEFQRAFAENPPDNKPGAILDGRDIGTVICPDADVKFFITASAEARAERRFKQLQDTGVAYEQILEDMKQRDERDRRHALRPHSARRRPWPSPARARGRSVTVD